MRVFAAFCFASQQNVATFGGWTIDGLRFLCPGESRLDCRFAEIVRRVTDAELSILDRTDPACVRAEEAGQFRWVPIVRNMRPFVIHPLALAARHQFCHTVATDSRDCPALPCHGVVRGSP